VAQDLLVCLGALEALGPLDLRVLLVPLGLLDHKVILDLQALREGQEAQALLVLKE
jgi:hypothetical protein